MSVRYKEFGTENTQIRRRATSKGLSFGPLATAITIGTVAVLLGVTFIGDWLRTPQVSAEASPSIISPNGDQTQDNTSFSYVLNEDANVTVQVYNEANRLIRTLRTNEFQTRGQHVVVWDGLDAFGQTVEDGRYQLRAIARGTVMASQQSAEVSVDTIPPTLRLANMTEQSRVRDANLTIEGLTDPNAVVRIQDDPSLIPVDTDGHFSLKRQLSEGTNTINLLATDPAGNVATISRELILITEPPEITVNSHTNDQWTNESLINVTGVVPSAESLKINGQEAPISQDGSFQHEVILQEGANNIRIEATDDVGNVGTQEFLVHRKTTPPRLTVNIEEGETFQQSELQVTGQTEPGATVLIGGQAIAVSPLGEFQAAVSLLNGDNLLEVTARDQAGNVTSTQRRVRYDVTAPETELARVARNLPNLSNYLVPIALSFPVLLILAYIMTRPVALVVSADRSGFQPGLPEEGRFIRLWVELSKPARTTVTIKDSKGNVAATMLHRRYRGSGQHTLYWNGYDDFGRPVPPGDYTIEATASTTGGTVVGTLNISVLEDATVHRQYLRNTPYQDESESEYLQTSLSNSRRSRR